MDRGQCSVYGTFCFLFSCTFQGDCSGWFNLENQDVGNLSPFAYRHRVTPRMMRSSFVQALAQLPPWIIAEKHRANFHFLSTWASLNHRKQATTRSRTHEQSRHVREAKSTAKGKCGRDNNNKEKPNVKIEIRRGFLSGFAGLGALVITRVFSFCARHAYQQN